MCHGVMVFCPIWEEPLSRKSWRDGTLVLLRVQCGSVAYFAKVLKRSIAAALVSQLNTLLAEEETDKKWEIPVTNDRHAGGGGCAHPLSHSTAKDPIQLGGRGRRGGYDGHGDGGLSD